MVLQMMYKTHKAGGVLGALVGFEIMRQQGVLIDDISYWAQLLVIYPAASWGSTSPDLDHHINSVKEQTPFNLVMHKLLHITNPKHRSWQTHSIYFTGVLCALLVYLTWVVDILNFGMIETAVIQLILMG